MAKWQSVRDFARGIVRIGQMEPEDVAEGNLWFDEADPRYAAKDPHSYDAHEYGKHPEFQSVSAETTTTQALEAGNLKHDGQVSDSLTNPTVTRLLTNDLFRQIENSYSVSEITADNSAVEIHQDSIRHGLVIVIGYEVDSGGARDFVDVLAVSRGGREITTVGEASDTNIARSYSDGEDAVEIAIDEDSETYNVAVWVVGGDLVV